MSELFLNFPVYGLSSASWRPHDWKNWSPATALHDGGGRCADFAQLDPVRPYPFRPSSGLVEQQAWFKLLRMRQGAKGESEGQS